MESSHLDASDISSVADLSVAENEDADFALLEEFRSLYEEVDKEYKRYLCSQMLVSCLREVPEHSDLLPKQLGEKLKRMILNTDVLESVKVKDKNGTECNMFSLKDEDLLELQSEVLSSEEESLVKTAAHTLLQEKCTAFRDKQNKIEKECKMLKCQKLEGSSGGFTGKMNKDLITLNEIAQKMELCESLIQSISEKQQKCVELEDKWKDIMMSACKNVEAKVELVNAEARVFNSKVVHEVCSENENFLKAVEILRSALQKEIPDAEHELKILNEKFKEYEIAEKDPAFKNIVKMYNKITKKQKHLNWCLESMNEK